MLLLACLEDGPAHGYRIAEDLRQRSGGALELQEGTLYPALYRLELRRLVTSRAVRGDARRRRTYRLTASGRRELAAQRDEWRAFARAVNAVTRRGREQSRRRRA